DEKPTGSKDPYALRRAALGVIRIVLENRLRLAFAGLLGNQADDLLAFFADRLKVQLREDGARHDLVDAVFALGGPPTPTSPLAGEVGPQGRVGGGAADAEPGASPPPDRSAFDLPRLGGGGETPANSP